MQNRDGTMSVLEHLAEVRTRLIIIAISILAASVFCFTRVEWIRQVLTKPLGDELFLIFLSPPEAFMANLRLSLIAGIVVAFPVILYQLAAFLFPAFYRHEKLMFSIILSGICVLFSAGVLFAFFVVFPVVLDFFLQFASAELDPEFTISAYISFTLSFHLAFGVVFQLPLLSWALGRVGLISSQFLRRNRKFALLIMLVLSAVITPPDVISQAAMAGPLLLLYELGILMVVISERKRHKAELAEGHSA